MYDSCALRRCETMRSWNIVSASYFWRRHARNAREGRKGKERGRERGQTRQQWQRYSAAVCALSLARWLHAWAAYVACCCCSWWLARLLLHRASRRCWKAREDGPSGYKGPTTPWRAESGESPLAAAARVRRGSCSWHGMSASEQCGRCSTKRRRGTRGRKMTGARRRQQKPQTTTSTPDSCGGSSGCRRIGASTWTHGAGRTGRGLVSALTQQVTSRPTTLLRQRTRRWAPAATCPGTQAATPLSAMAPTCRMTGHTQRTRTHAHTPRGEGGVIARTN